jgi:hypothetical protein
MKLVAAINVSRLEQFWLRYQRPVQKTLISLGIVAYFTLAVIHLWPDRPLSIKLKEPTRTLCEFFGWVQNWHLFGPELRTNNFHVLGLIGYADGTIGSWEPPRFDMLNLRQRYEKDKFHKWDQDCVPWDNYRDFWPGLARYVGRLHYDKSNPPVWFMLLRYEADIPDPLGGKIADHDRMPPHTRLLNSFTYHFKPEDLQ